MSFICELGAPPDDCYGLNEYIEEFIVSLGLIDNFRYGTGAATTLPTSTVLDNLWAPCDPPDCAVAIWYNPTGTGGDPEFTTWSYIASTWRQTGTKVGLITPYYTSFEGDYADLAEAWDSDWVIDGQGNAKAALTVSPTNLLLNPDFEVWTIPTPPDNWIVGVGSVAEEVVIVNSGSSSCKLIVAGGPASASISQTVAVTEARWFKLTGATRPGAGGSSGYAIGGTWLGQSASSSVPGAWALGSCTDFSLDTSAVIAASAFLFDGYADTMGLAEITDGWKAQKELYTAYGTLYADLTFASSDYMGVLVNYVDEDNYILVMVSQAKVYIVGVVAGVATQIAQSAIVYAPGARLEVVCYAGNTMDVTYDGIPEMVAQAVTFDVTGTLHGMVSTAEDGTFQAFGFTPA